MTATVAHICSHAAPKIAEYVLDEFRAMPPSTHESDATTLRLKRLTAGAGYARALHEITRPPRVTQKPCSKPLAECMAAAQALGYRVVREPDLLRDAHPPEIATLRHVQGYAARVFRDLRKTENPNVLLIRAAVVAYREAGETLCDMMPNGDVARKRFQAVLGKMESYLPPAAMPSPYQQFLEASMRLTLFCWGVPRRFQQSHLHLVPNTGRHNAARIKMTWSF